MLKPDAAQPGAPPSVAEIFSALGDPTRLGLLTRLSNGGACSITRLSADSSLTRQAVTKHLGVLQRAGLVSRRHVGRESLFRYEPQSLGQARAYLDQVSAQWDAALARLQAFVED
ncbi:MAG: helix-turn-helix transcriptional regulator [Caulobacteraceae bacterium]|nr:helix-turn-helix transcriptional regulator [Caulobacteraceae bacterium]